MTLPVINPNASLAELTRIVAQMANKINQIEERTKPNIDGWAGNQTNVTELRTIDVTTATLTQLANVVCTLIQDEINRGGIT